jgi:hypothetical protein
VNAGVNDIKVIFVDEPDDIIDPLEDPIGGLNQTLGEADALSASTVLSF